MKKKILKTILVIIILLVIGIGYFIYTDFQQEDKLRAELEEINNLTNAENIDIDLIDERLDRIVTTGDYAIVEDAFKSYLRENFENIKQIVNIISDDKITTLLTVENYKEDGKDFVETQNYINTTIKNLEECKTKYKEFFTEEKAMSYINNKGLDSYYIDLYKQEFVGDIENDNSDDNTVEKSIDEIIAILNKSESVVNFLINNKDNWEIQGENISFNSDELSKQYSELLEKVTE